MNKQLTMLATALLLAACTAIPVKTLYKLATTDPMAVDPSVLRVAARMPDWIAPRPDGAIMELGIEHAGDKPIKERFILEPVPLARERDALAAAQKTGYTLYAYRLKPQDIPRLQALRDTIKAKKADGGQKPQSSLSVGVDACRKAALPKGKLPVTTYLRLDADADYLPLLVDYDIRQVATEQDLETSLPPCAL